MLFRPYPVLTLLALPVLGVLIWLGVWQADRAAWKATLIADFEAAAQAEPVDAVSVLCSGEPAAGRIVQPAPASGQELRMFGQNAAGATGWRAFRAVQICDGAATLVQTDFEALKIGDLPVADETPRPVDRLIVEPIPDRSAFAAPNSPERNEWHWFDIPAMSAALAGEPLDERYMLVPFAGVPDYLERTPPARHIGYSVTWFGMAGALLLLYAAFHARAGRLRFRKPDAGTK